MERRLRSKFSPLPPPPRQQEHPESADEDDLGFGNGGQGDEVCADGFGVEVGPGGGVVAVEGSRVAAEGVNVIVVEGLEAGRDGAAVVEDQRQDVLFGAPLEKSTILF